MPDDDRLPRSLSARWRRVLKAFQAGESQEAIEHHVAKATAETLRRTHGVPELPALGAQVYVAAATGYDRHGVDGGSRAPSTARKALGLTVSCDVGFAARVPEHRACGACTSCLLRLQSLTAAGLTGLLPMDIHERQGHDRDFNINAMIWQVTRLRAYLGGSEPWRRMVSEFPELIDVTSLTQQEVVRLYRAYVEEWGSNEDAVRSHGFVRRESRTVALCLMTPKTRPNNPRR